MRITTLNAAKAGINRLRIKGSPSPETLYDLLNGYVNASGQIQSRPGTVVDATLPAGTKGLCAFNGGMVVFSASPKVVPAGYRCESIAHPTDQAQELVEIHFAAPFLNVLYVVAEFANGDVFHYWLQHADAWKASTSYAEGALVEPTTPNGFVYRAHRIGAAGIPWAPSVARAVGAVVEPTTPNGFKYTAVSTLGANPRSGTVEPTWPKTDGAQVIEDTSGAPAPPADTTPAAPGPQNPDRYGNVGGSGNLSGRRTQQL